MPVYIAPVNTAYTGRWGYYPSGRVHKAVDYPVATGTAVRAAGNGVIKVAGWSLTGFGRHVRLLLDDGNTVIYGHLSSYACKPGQRVASGQVIAYSNNTGNSTGPHIHMEVRRSSWQPWTSWDFTPYLRKWSTTTTTATPGLKTVDLSTVIYLSRLRAGNRNVDVARFEKALWNFNGSTWRARNASLSSTFGDGYFGTATTNAMRFAYAKIGIPSPTVTYPGRTLLTKLGFKNIR